MNTQPNPPVTPVANPPSPWLGVLGVAVVVAFAGLAVLDTSFTPNVSSAQASASVPAVTPNMVTTAVEDSLDVAQQPIPLYLSESGAHAPETKPTLPPGPEATSLFDTP